MNRTLLIFSIVFFSIFLGSQITEGYLLIPQWKTLSQVEFYEYYSNYGTRINNFYKVLTIISVLIPIILSIYCLINKSLALKHSIVSATFALLVIVFFYVYFKSTNQQFYNAAFNANELQSTLKTYGNLHWMRVFCEIISLIFLIFTVRILTEEKTLKKIELYTL